MALVLNIESATSVCSVALGQDGELVATASAKNTYQHARQITLLIESVMQESGRSLKDLDAIAVSQGPGSYTALRVGMSAAKGLCYGLDLPLIGIPTLKILAKGVLKQLPEDLLAQKPLIVPMIDARRMEVYTQLFDEKTVPKNEKTAQIIKKSSYKAFFDSRQYLIFTGDGAAKCQSLLDSPYAVFYPSEAQATDMLLLSEAAFQSADFLDIAYAEPFYVKAPNITKPKKLL
jgi:tRNA threonylcarbamoyladenosine biosynthesis protein TsaB